MIKISPGYLVGCQVDISGMNGGVSWPDETFTVNGCGGYARARSFVAAEVDSSTYTGNLVLHGESFTMG
ncbi:MspA family porin [Nocardia sp. NPDC101769]|uniref:MspA family porin n=1 Tax=Nocardia sp. NPDC101769 TaxID=3364333 RepID=UPI00382FE570